MIKNKKRGREAKERFVVPKYRRPSRRGGNGGKRELLVASVSRTDGAYRYREQIVPYIRMSGLWLERLGFHRGDRIEITAESERLVLTVSHEATELPIN